MHALVFANGELDLPPGGLPQADLRIAANGGSRHCRALGVYPDVVVGDLDSLEPELQAELKAHGTQLLAHPARKDETDFELALLHAQQVGASAVTVVGGLGRRWDHSLANLMLAADARFAALPITFLHGSQRLFPIRQHVQLDAPVGSRVSLIPLAGDVLGVTTQGLEYPLQAERIPFGSSRGISNVVAAAAASVSLERGLLLCVLTPADYD
ncbi:MAG: thiamine diphosphokinase [Anaerolineales bacterium]|nr:thiamine diphosphokinase [Anaerolineales bacterium]